MGCFQIAVFLAAAAFLPQFALADPETLSQHTSIKSVAIISAIGETFQFEHIRDAAFEWFAPTDASFLEISDWGLDDFVTHTASAELSKRHKVVPVKYLEGAFDTWTWYTLDRNLRELPPADDDIDAYVVILRDWRGDAIGDSVHRLGGLGFYRRDGANTPPKLGVFASYRIVVVDARTYTILASRPARSAVDTLPWTAAPSTLWPATQNDLSDGQKADLQRDEQKLISDTLASTLDRIDPVRTPLISRGRRSRSVWHRLLHRHGWRN